MSLIEVVEPGTFSTVQDLGRFAYGDIGVSACGAADALALRVGNRLLGNMDGAAAIEMTLTGGVFRFHDRALIALTGGYFESSHPLWSACSVGPGDVVRIGPAVQGARCYLCVRGGVATSCVLGSRSTHVPSRLGGIDGGPLRAGQRLDSGEEPDSPPRLRVRRSMLEALAYRRTLRVTAGPQSEMFSQGLEGEYEVSERSNRTGVRLLGAALQAPPGGMLTEGVALGAIQVPPDGQPIILFVDAQTTGGYPIIANVIAADLPSVGQLRPRDRVRFELVSFDEARRLYLEQEELLASDELLW